MTDLATKVKDAGSDEAAAKVLLDQRTELAERIRQRELTGHGKPPASSRLRQTVGWLNNQVGHETALVERNPEMIEKHREVILTALNVLNKALAAQSSADQ